MMNSHCSPRHRSWLGCRLSRQQRTVRNWQGAFCHRKLGDGRGKDVPRQCPDQPIGTDIQGDRQQAMDKMKKFRDWGMTRFKQKGIDNADKLRAQMLDDCKAVTALLATKATPQEAREYRQWALSVAEKVATAASEGSFLGFGGERVSDTEKQLIVQIRTALGDRANAA